MTYSEVSKVENQFVVQNRNDNTVKKNYLIPIYQININETISKPDLIYCAIPILKCSFDFISTKNKFIDYLKNKLNDFNPEFGFIKLEQLLTYLKDFFHSKKAW